ncbi:sulfatase-like hydrolase/transferase, partial [Acinetobacter baumannii]
SQQTHVPMIMWFSESWKQHNLAQVNCLSQQTKQKLSQDNLFPSLLSLLDIKTKVIAVQNDMLNNCK